MIIRTKYRIGKKFPYNFHGLGVMAAEIVGVQTQSFKGYTDVQYEIHPVGFRPEQEYHLTLLEGDVTECLQRITSGVMEAKG